MGRLGLGAAVWSFAVAAGLGAGVGSYTFVYARGYSYLTNDPAACANCHVMRDYLDGWTHSSHHSVAVCNDCHTPHEVVGKYTTKALNGFWHSYAFTTGWYPDPLQITPRNRRIAEEACLHCHADVVEAMGAGSRAPGETGCARCHGTVGHPRR